MILLIRPPDSRGRETCLGAPTLPNCFSILAIFQALEAQNSVITMASNPSPEKSGIAALGPGVYLLLRMRPLASFYWAPGGGPAEAWRPSVLLWP